MSHFLNALIAVLALTALCEGTVAEARSKKRTGVKATKVAKADKDQPQMGVAANAGLVYVGPGFGAEVFANVTRRLQVGVQALTVSSELSAAQQAKDSGESAALLNEYMSINLTAMKFQSRYFLTTSTYVSGGLSYNQISGDYGYTLGDTDEKLTHGYQADAFLGHLGIGNQWRFASGLVIGCEWLGLATFLSNNVVATTNTSTVKTERTSGDAKKETSAEGEAEFTTKVDESLRSQIQFSAAMVTVGMEF